MCFLPIITNNLNLNLLTIHKPNQTTTKTLSPPPTFMSPKMTTTILVFSVLFIVRFFPATAQIVSTYPGDWHLLHESIGISAMHMQLLRNNKVVIFDRTDFGPSNLSLPDGHCRFDLNDTALTTDCTAHSILYDIGTNSFSPLTVQTDTWCSSGAVLPNGTLVQTGGYNDGDRVIRTLSPFDDWVENPWALSRRRWYASNHILPDGSVIIVGGRGQPNYEFYPKDSSSDQYSFDFHFLRETRDDDENNLYPFLHLLPDGNLFVFANTRAVVLDYKQNRIVREFPSIPGDDPRNYPSSGSSVLLPIDENRAVVEPEIMVCGGAKRGAFQSAKRGNFIRSISTCGRLKITSADPAWEMEEMPMARVMSDMVLLPDGNVMIINGAGSGSAGWGYGRDPVTRPLIYNPTREAGARFYVMGPSNRPRLYHSTAVLLTDGRVMVGGSNPNTYYNFTGVDFPTDLSLESFSPPYLMPRHDLLRPRIMGIDETIGYGGLFSLTFSVPMMSARANDLSVRVVAPSFNTHSFSMNQRMVVLRKADVTRIGSEDYRVSAYAPSAGEIAPAGYYLLFVLHSSIPSSGAWVRIQ